MKYIIKNCPAYEYDEEFNYHICKQPLVPYECSVDYCQNCPDCIIKQIVEKCRKVDSENFDQWCFANSVLEDIEIEEVDEE